MVKRILRIGIPNGIEGSVFQVGKLMVQGFITVFGTASIAANAISSSVVSFTNIPGGAISLASITIILAIPTVVASFWGMNVHVPFGGHPLGFWSVLGIAALFAGGSAFLLWKKHML